ncbi:MAG: hypothetical protein AB7W16_27380 [Candidatus Obscuribacterales bacterium]
MHRISIFLLILIGLIYLQPVALADTAPEGWKGSGEKPFGTFSLQKD